MIIGPIGLLTKLLPKAAEAIGKAILPKLGIGKGHGTDAGIMTTAVGLIAAKATGLDPFESAKVLIDLGQQAWPHILILFGALTTAVSWFRKAGAHNSE